MSTSLAREREARKKGLRDQQKAEQVTRFLERMLEGVGPSGAPLVSMSRDGYAGYPSHDWTYGTAFTERGHRRYRAGARGRLLEPELGLRLLKEGFACGGQALSYALGRVPDGTLRQRHAVPGSVARR